MLAYEFNTVVRNNTILIPEEYQDKIFSDVRVIVLPGKQDNHAEKQQKALERFWEETDDLDEPLGSAFDEIINHRVNFTREIDL